MSVRTRSVDGIGQFEGCIPTNMFGSSTRFSDEILPKESSRNFTEGEIGFPILDVILYPGDLLYFPRGTIHQVCVCT